MTEVFIKDTIDRMIDRINAISEPGPGFTRPSYSALESAAHQIVAEECGVLGLEVTRDPALNLFARLPGKDRTAPPLYIGSHLDTVPMGGAFDGQAGVAGAVALAAAFVKSGEVPSSDIVVTVTRAEESVWFPVSYVGSRAALGRLTAPEMQALRADTGRTLADHMAELGGDPEAVLRGPGLAPARFVELHIEQGPVLDNASEAFGIVHGVRGGLRYRKATIEGAWAHSGGAPREARSDAVFAFADLVVGMDAAWERVLQDGQDLAVTFGRVDAASNEHAFAKVPGRLDFCVDIRSDDDRVLDRVDTVLLNEIARIEKARGVRFILGPQSRSQPTKLSSGLAAEISGAAAKMNLSPRTMLSGGGHDAAAFAQAGWDSVMVFLRNWNGSHNPDEAMNPADLALAVQVLHRAWSGL
ncbi:hydantoinase/carbamoylase family amidase [Rhizobium sp. RM]|uniref:hydantoinase/carbamoylase family amidase n=1 Tax=Rhizobium sp. RM TaxID=2748079 RepID=UPI00110EDED9|nr:hydantoinase/carbamoylase family amidase [Rhizobium sp. RM]NWJ27425.1 hydantoinase/carbamoylase family amidase [Rhizobium sp. RM]TMV20475.1 hydantoinase/carbamoylase family amidase [Rhizobium sp. Td3]